MRCGRWPEGFATPRNEAMTTATTMGATLPLEPTVVPLVRLAAIVAAGSEEAMRAGAAACVAAAVPVALLGKTRSIRTAHAAERVFDPKPGRWRKYELTTRVEILHPADRADADRRHRA